MLSSTVTARWCTTPLEVLVPFQSTPCFPSAATLERRFQFDPPNWTRNGPSAVRPFVVQDRANGEVPKKPAPERPTFKAARGGERRRVPGITGEREGDPGGSFES